MKIQGSTIIIVVAVTNLAVKTKFHNLAFFTEKLNYYINW